MECITKRELKLYHEINRLEKIIDNLNESNEKLSTNLYRAESILNMIKSPFVESYYNNKR